MVLAFTSNHIGAAFDKLFGLSGVPDDYTEFDTSVLLRLAQKDRIDAIVTGVQGGVFSPSEARSPRPPLLSVIKTLCRRDRIEAFGRAPSPSASLFDHPHTIHGV